jgi:hypothetical protein
LHLFFHVDSRIGAQHFTWVWGIENEREHAEKEVAFEGKVIADFGGEKGGHMAKGCPPAEEINALSPKLASTRTCHHKEVASLGLYETVDDVEELGESLHFIDNNGCLSSEAFNLLLEALWGGRIEAERLWIEEIDPKGVWIGGLEPGRFSCAARTKKEEVACWWGKVSSIHGILLLYSAILPQNFSSG